MAKRKKNGSADGSKATVEQKTQPSRYDDFKRDVSDTGQKRYWVQDNNWGAGHYEDEHGNTIWTMKDGQ